MPTYEYLCRACGERLEVVQSFSDAALTTCDACGGDLRKVFSAAGLIFKGSGWHVKDYSSSSTSSASASSTGASTSSSKDTASKDAGGSTAPSSDAKPAPASTPAPAAASSTGD